MTEAPTFEVTLPRALATVLADTDALDDVEVTRGRGGSLRLSGSAEAIVGVHDRLWGIAPGSGGDPTSAERSAYRRWEIGLHAAGIHP
jgi:hypothetical protein